jgi:glycosyltransferase involved in cell wall biosynthesis
VSRLTAVFSASSLGGSELFNLEFLRRVREHGVEVDAIVPAEGSVVDALRSFVRSLRVVELPSSLQTVSRFDPGVPLRTLPSRMQGLGRYARRLRIALRATAGPVCALGFRSQLAVAVAGQGLGRPVCWVVHEVVPEGPFARLWKLAARRVDSVFTYSDAAASQRGLSGAPVSVLPIRLALAPFLELQLPSPPPTVLGLVGDLFPIKNQLGFVEVVRRLRESDENVEGRLFGRDTSPTNPTADYVQAVREASGPDVSLAAVEPSEMPARLAQIDLLLHLTTVPETFGRVCAEAMAAGRPVVGFDHGAVGQMIDTSTNGILCPVNDLHAVVRAIRKLRRQPVLYSRLSAAARKTAYRRWGPGQSCPSIGDALAAFALDREPTRR